MPAVTTAWHYRGRRLRRQSVFTTSVALLACLLLIGCSSPKAPTATAVSGGGSGGVPWSDYAAGTQARIDGLAASKDCSGLQGEFETADANNTATMNRTGHNNAELMGYIDAKLRGAACY